MPLICKECPNKTNFCRKEWGSVSYTETGFYDQFEEWTDNSDYETHDSDMDDCDSMECADCETTNIEDVSEEEWEDWEGPVTTTPPTNWKEKYEQEE